MGSLIYYVVPNTEAAAHFGAHAATNLQLPAAAKALGLPEAFKSHGEGIRDGLLYIAFAMIFVGVLSSQQNRTTSDCILLLSVVTVIFLILLERNKRLLPPLAE